MIDSFTQIFDYDNEYSQSICINKSDYIDFIKPLIKDNKIVVTAYICVYVKMTGVYSNII